MRTKNPVAVSHALKTIRIISTESNNEDVKCERITREISNIVKTTEYFQYSFDTIRAAETATTRIQSQTTRISDRKIT